MTKLNNKRFKLCNKKEIDLLFKEGRSINKFPFKLYWFPRNEDTDLNKIVISISKRSIKRAVDRNKLKRQLKEIYFKNVCFNKLTVKDLNIGIVFYGDQKFRFEVLEEKLIQAIQIMVNKK